MEAIEIIEHISEIIKTRLAEWVARNPTVEYVPSDTDFLTAEERETFHQAKMQLPSYGELAVAARERLKAKIAKRRQTSLR